MNTKSTLQPKTCSVSGPLIAVDKPERIDALARYARIASALLFALCIGHASELPRPGEAIDAGDSYPLKDGSRVVLHRVLNEVTIETWGRFPIKKYGVHPIVCGR